MLFQRPQASRTLNKEERAALLQDYVNYYRQAAKQDLGVLNRKIPRGAFNELLGRIGGLLMEYAKALSKEPGPVRDFLDENPLPKPLEGLLPDDFRVYCLAVNALKQWMTAEQSATDRCLLGGQAREACRSASATCLVTGELLESGEGELHHPVRDGRPPILLSKEGHDRLESRGRSVDKDGNSTKICAIRKRMNRSWINLRLGCLDLLGKEAEHSTPSVAASSKTFARTVAQETGLTPEQVLAWLDAHHPDDPC